MNVYDDSEEWDGYLTVTYSDTRVTARSSGSDHLYIFEGVDQQSAEQLDQLKGENDNSANARISLLNQSPPSDERYSVMMTPMDNRGAVRMRRRSQSFEDDNDGTERKRVFPRLPDPPSLEVLKIGHSCKMPDSAPELPPLETEAKDKMISTVQELKKQNMTMAGGCMEPLVFQDVSEISATQTEDELSKKGILPPKGKKKRLKTRKELNKLLSKMRIMDASESENSGPVARLPRTKPRRMSRD